MTSENKLKAITKKHKITGGKITAKRKQKMVQNKEHKELK